MGFLTHIKDKVSSFAGSIVLKKKIERYGTMLDFRIDSENKKIFLRVSLKGEQQPLDIVVDRYSLKRQGEVEVIVIESVTISKEWMNLLAADLLKKKEFLIPKGISSTVAGMVL